jgi:hypothetical protein
MEKNAKSKTQAEVIELPSFLQKKIVKIVPIVRPNSWSYKYQIIEDGKDKTNGSFQFNTAKTYLSVPKDKRTGLMIRPLDNIKKMRTAEYPDDEITEQEFFERVLGLNKGDLDISRYKTDENGNRYPDTFWQKEGTVVLRNEANVLNLSIPIDMLKYKVLMINKNVVAPSPADKNKKRTYRFMIVDQQVAEIEEKQELSIVLEAAAELNRIKADIEELKQIMWLNDLRITETSNYDYVFKQAGNIALKDPNKFLSIIKDPNKEVKLLLMKAVKAGHLILTKERTYRFLDGRDIGTQHEAIKFLNNNENFAITENLKERLELSK